MKLDKGFQFLFLKFKLSGKSWMKKESTKINLIIIFAYSEPNFILGQALYIYM